MTVNSLIHINLVRFSSLGDCVLLCPFIEYLSEQGARVTVITRSTFHDVFASANGVDRVLSWKKEDGSNGLHEIIRQLTPGIVIDAHNTTRSRWLCRKIGGAHITFKKNYGQRLGLIVFKREASIPTMLENYANLATATDLPVPSLKPGGITLDPNSLARARELLPADRAHLAIAPGSRWPDKRWPANHYAALAQHAADNGRNIVLVGDTDDSKHCDEIASRMGGSVINLAGECSIMETAAVISRCDGFVGNDSGLMHLAEAVGVPVLALFGPTVEAFGYFPSGPSSRVLERSLSCRPCSRNGAVPCIRGTNECLTAISVDDVQGALDTMLNSSQAAR